MGIGPCADHFQPDVMVFRIMSPTPDRSRSISLSPAYTAAARARVPTKRVPSSVASLNSANRASNVSTRFCKCASNRLVGRTVSTRSPPARRLRLFTRHASSGTGDRIKYGWEAATASLGAGGAGAGLGAGAGGAGGAGAGLGAGGAGGGGGCTVVLRRDGGMDNFILSVGSPWYAFERVTTIVSRVVHTPAVSTNRHNCRSRF